MFTSNALEENQTDRELAGKYLIFPLSNEEYGIDILKVREILGMQPIKPVVMSEPFVRGVINLREQIIPIVDLRLKFGMEKAVDTSRTCIAITILEINGQRIDIGVVVDTVSEVVDIRIDQIEHAPQCRNDITKDIITGIAKFDHKSVILLDIEKVIASDNIDYAKLTQAAG